MTPEEVHRLRQLNEPYGHARALSAAINHAIMVGDDEVLDTVRETIYNISMYMCEYDMKSKPSA